MPQFWAFISGVVAGLPADLLTGPAPHSITSNGFTFDKCPATRASALRVQRPPKGRPPKGRRPPLRGKPLRARR